MRSIISAQYRETERILKEHMDKLVSIAELLLDKETISGEEFEACFAG